MIQVSVAEHDNTSKFNATDKVIICRYENRYYAIGSFCGFDYTNLGKGVFLGDKIFCPTCGSSYDIASGFVDDGPSLRNVSSFVIGVRPKNEEEQNTETEGK